MPTYVFWANTLLAWSLTVMINYSHNTRVLSIGLMNRFAAAMEFRSCALGFISFQHMLEQGIAGDREEAVTQPANHAI